jgi:hypothetical protein
MKVKVIASLCVIALMSSCSVTTHTTADGQRWKSAGKNHHYQIKNGIVTRQKGTPSCVQNW